MRIVAINDQNYTEDANLVYIRCTLDAFPIEIESQIVKLNEVDSVVVEMTTEEAKHLEWKVS